MRIAIHLARVRACVRTCLCVCVRVCGGYPATVLMHSKSETDVG